MTELVAEEQAEEVPVEEFIEDYGLKLFLTGQNYYKKISNVSLRMSGEQQLKDGDSIVQELSATNKSDVLFFSNKGNAYKARAYDLPDSKASSLGEYLTNLLSLEEGEAIVRMAATTDYSGHIIFGFANGKMAKISMQGYATKTNRKKLIGGCSDKSPIIFAVIIQEDTDIIVFRSDNKAMLFNTALISPVSAKNSAGVQVFSARKGHNIVRVCFASEIEAEEPEYYRVDKIPAAGHFVAG